MLNRGLSRKWNPAPPATSPSCGQQPLHQPRRPAPVELRRASVFGNPPPRDKDHHRASRKWRSESTPQTPSAQVLNRGAVVDDPVAPPRPQRRSLRSSSSVAAKRPITKMESGAAGDITIVRPAAAAPPRRPAPVELRRASVFGNPPPRDKDHHRASRKWRRESTPQTCPRNQPSHCRIAENAHAAARPPGRQSL